MKKIWFMLVVVSCVWMVIQPGCRDPYDFEPPDDTLLPPPGAPITRHPPDRFVTMHMGSNYYITIDWDSVAGAEIYVVEITGETDDPQYFNLDSTALRFCILITDMLGHYQWRVCAGSSSWQGGYTEYSPLRNFEARAQPDGPVLVYPPNGVVFYLDSLSADLTLRWDTVQDEEFYELEVYHGVDTVENITTVQTSYILGLVNSGTYTWHVRANSRYWQYPGKWSSWYTFFVIFS
ncbi:MAG TPA: hypothetical protein VF399_09255 [bacterium]